MIFVINSVADIQRTRPRRVRRCRCFSLFIFPSFAMEHWHDASVSVNIFDASVLSYWRI